MGAICGGAEPSQVPQNTEERKPIQVFGDKFDPDTRTVCALLEMANARYEFKEVDQFKGQHKDFEYLSLNPTGSVPLIVDNKNTVFGSTRILITYLTNNISQLKREMPEEHMAAMM